MTPFESAPSLAGDDPRAQLQRALECLAAGDAEGARQAARAAADSLEIPDRLVVDADGRGYRIGTRAISLQRRGNLRRILVALADAAERAPGSTLTRDDVLAAGWPGERMRAESGALRVYTAIRRLRQGGLGSALLTRDDGYLIDPRVRVVRLR